MPRNRGSKERKDRRGRLPRLPCGCDPEELAADMGIPLEQLLRSAANAASGSAPPGEFMLVTAPYPPLVDIDPTAN
jgi:hypothetical protein